MNLATLSKIVAGGESEHIEFKRTTGELKAGMQTVCAMLNGLLPGWVLFGVGNQGQIGGQDVAAGTLEDVANHLRRIEPPAFPDIETVALENGKQVIALGVPGGSGLFTYEGRPYHRVGSTTSRLPTALYEQRLRERMHATERWENRAAIGFGIEDLDNREIILTIEEAIRRQRLEEPSTRDPAQLLLGLGLVEDGRLLNAAMVLFGQSNRMLSRYPQCLLRMARFRGEDKAEFTDNRQEIGNAFELFVRAQRFLRDHLPVAGKVIPDLFARIDEPLYPTEALREALANALCHRDYAIGGGSVSIGIYDDRLEIASTGALPFGLTPEDLTRPHSSRPWNPLIAQVFYRRGIIESWGRGTIKMAELTRDAGLPAPEFESRSGEVIVRFRPARYLAPTRVGHDLSPLQRNLLEVLAQIGPASLKQVLEILEPSFPERTVQDNLQALRLFDLVETRGKGRGARWKLKGGP